MTEADPTGAKKDSPSPNDKPASSLDEVARLAADLFLYAPVGLAKRLSAHLPDLAKSGREALQTPLTAAKIMGKHTVDQQRATFGSKLREATAPFTSGDSATEPVHYGAPQEADAAASSPVDPATTSAPPTPKGAPDPSSLPIEGYATLSASQVLTHLDGLDPEQLVAVEAYELATRARSSILKRIEQLRSSK